MTETKPTNYQIRINVSDTQENVYKIAEAIESLQLGYTIRIDEIPDKCTACGQLDGTLHDYVCDACLILEKEKRQREEDAKYDDDKRGTEWDWVAFCPECGLPANYDSDECCWYCPHENCTNYLPDRSVNADGFKAHRLTIAELTELKEKFPFAEWI